MIKLTQTKDSEGNATVKVVHTMVEVNMGKVFKPLEYLRKYDGAKRAEFLRQCKEAGIDDSVVEGWLIRPVAPNK